MIGNYISMHISIIIVMCKIKHFILVLDIKPIVITMIFLKMSFCVGLKFEHKRV